MNVQDLPRRINASDELVACFDVSKKKLDGYAIHSRTGASDREVTMTIERRADQIEEQLSELASYADEHGLDGLCVVCEPTGGEALQELAIATGGGTKQADVVWASVDRPEEMKQTGDPTTLAPEVCVEVLSSSNTEGGIREKRGLYFESGAEEVWVVDKDDRVRFFGEEEMERSKLVPEFPKEL